MGQSICPYFLPTFTPLELSVFFLFLRPFPRLARPCARARAPAPVPQKPPLGERRDATRRDFHSIVPRPRCAWPERVALGTRTTIISSLSLFLSLGEGEKTWENEEEEEVEVSREASFPPCLSSPPQLYSSLLSSFHSLSHACLPARVSRGKEGEDRVYARRKASSGVDHLCTEIHGPQFVLARQRTTERGERGKKRKRDWRGCVGRLCGLK